MIATRSRRGVRLTLTVSLDIIEPDHRFKEMLQRVIVLDIITDDLVIAWRGIETPRHLAVDPTTRTVIRGCHALDLAPINDERVKLFAKKASRYM